MTITSEEKLIEKLIKINKNIKCLYDNMNSLNKEKLENELLFNINKENKLLDELNITEQNSQKIYNNFVRILEDNILEEYRVEVNDKKLEEMFNIYLSTTKKEAIITNDLILKRFESYLLAKFRSVPKKFNSKDKKLNEKQNKAIIKYQANKDFLSTTVVFLTNLEEKTENLKEANEAISLKTKILFSEKQIEENYFNNDLANTGFKSCLDNGQDPKLVDKTYKELLFENINEYGCRCYLYSNKDLKVDEERTQFNISLECFKSGLFLLDRTTLNEVIIDYTCKNLNNKKQSAKLLIDGMNEVRQFKNFQNKQKCM